MNLVTHNRSECGLNSLLRIFPWQTTRDIGRGINESDPARGFKLFVGPSSRFYFFSQLELSKAHGPWEPDQITNKLIISLQ